MRLDPGGTAPRCDVFVLVELPLPWPSDVGADPHMADIERAVRAQVGPARSVRLQALFVDAAATMRRVLVFTAGDGPFTGYRRLEGCAAPAELAETAAGLVASDPRRPIARRVTDVLVCTHGARDRCCGSLGTRLWRDVVDTAGVRVWRTSHTGGHRFAPTAITFPDGNYWAYLDPGLLEGIVDRSLRVEAAASLLRGCAAFPPAVQVADRAALAIHGWTWLSHARFGEERGGNRVGLCFQSADGSVGGYDVCLTNGRRMPVPDCGNDPAAAAKSQPEWRVTRIQAWL